MDKFASDLNQNIKKILSTKEVADIDIILNCQDDVKTELSVLEAMC